MSGRRADHKVNLLFVCSRNRWRSPTAEAVWRKHPDVRVRSAGTSARARRRVSEQDLRWADVVFVLEEKHQKRLVAEFHRATQHKPLHDTWGRSVGGGRRANRGLECCCRLSAWSS